MRALSVQLGDLALERRSDLLLGDGAGALGPIARDILFAVRRSIDSTSPPPFARALRRLRVSWVSALSIRKAGGIRPLRARP